MAQGMTNSENAENAENAPVSANNNMLAGSEKSTTLPILTEINMQFGLKNVDPNGYSPLNLAYIGDSVFDVVVKTVLVEKGNTQVNKLHRATSSIVKAPSQAKMAEALAGVLTDEEANILRRGRNAKPYTKAKNATYHEYCLATGLEALVGYLYLKGETARLVELIKIGIEKI